MLCIALIILHGVSASLIASSEIKFCTRKKSSYEPMLDGKPCKKKFLVALAVRNGQVNAISTGFSSFLTALRFCREHPTECMLIWDMSPTVQEGLSAGNR